jgi:GTP-binding protein Era
MSLESANKISRCGFVAIVGRPNVGKSTLLNRILGHKVSITARRPQTTRHRILGIKTTREGQTIYIDTPGLQTDSRRAMNRYLNRTAGAAVHDVDAVVVVVEATHWEEGDQRVLDMLLAIKAPVFLAVNKVDKVADKRCLLPELERLATKRDFVELVPLSATTGENVSVLESQVFKVLPVTTPLFPEEQVTDRSERFLAAELIREKLIRHLGQELPYTLTVEVEQFTRAEKIILMSAIIWVERPGQKMIVIGKGGAVLKQVGEQARLEMERLFGQRVYVQLWVKVRKGWTDDESALRAFGYTDTG